MEKLNLLSQNGEVYYFPEFIGESESKIYLKKFTDEILWRQEPIKIMGKEIMQPRLTAWYGDPDKPGKYSGISMIPIPWNSLLLSLKLIIEEKTGIQFTSVLLNLYRDGKDSMGWHRDNEKELGPEPTIASVSFGQTRKFQFRDYKEKNALVDIALTSGSLLIMNGKTNHYWEHRIPKTTKLLGPRINLTFRKINR